MEKISLSGLPPFELAHPSGSDLDIRRSATVAALELVRAAMLSSTRPPAEHLEDLSGFVEEIEKVLVAKGRGSARSSVPAR